MNIEKLNIATFTVYLSIAALAVKLLVSPSFGEVDEEVVEGNVISYICDFIILSCCALSSKIIHKKFKSIFVTFFVIFISFILGTLLAGGSAFDSIKSLLRLFVPFLFFSVLCSYFYSRKDELITVSKFLILFVIILTIVGLFVLPPSVNRWEGDNEGLWWPAYFNGIHTTTYIVISLYFVVYSMYKIGAVSKSFALMAFCSCFYSVAFGWGVRTTTLSMIVLMLMNYYYLFGRDLYKKSSVIVGALVLVVIYFYISFDWEYMDRVSSGRLSMYEFKYYQLMDNSLFSWILGNGAGSDLVETDFWWWEAKGAHSDFITFLVEGGLVYFCAFLFLLYKLSDLVPSYAGKSIVYALFVTSVFSNGFFVRPLALYFVLFSLALLYVRDTKLSLSRNV